MGNGSGQGQRSVQWKAHVGRAYESNSARIVAMLARTYGSSRAEDAVQEAFMRALSWKRVESRRECVMSAPFMTRCASRVALRHIRTETRRQGSERGWWEVARSVWRGKQTPDQRAELAERCGIAVKVLEELPSWQRPVVQMMVADRRRQRDVARITGVRTTTQSNWRNRFVTELRVRLREHD